ncbi:hypothetical protein [Roseibium aggregatum]|uniref:Virulence factor Evf domain-containing protein n=1 Tax=Roseibium aggregatum TaxID=187304 RepID=A0A939EGW6_9HYPH|nr:hypothetical protein [Roseibium aggregatum]MBN9671319.1 hypothetical protein [Roseibium aggregatum]
MSAALAEKISNASTFFVPSPARHSLLAAAELALAEDPQGQTPQMFQADQNTTGSVLQFNGTIPDDLPEEEKKVFAKLLSDQQFYLQSGLGLVTAWMTHNYQRQPDKWADPNNWQAPLSNIPAEFYTPTDITSYRYQEHIKGIQIATKFLENLITWAAAEAIAPAFGSFLTSLGDQISAGIKSKYKEMNTYHLSFSYQPILNSARIWELKSVAEYYFISFTEKEKTVYSTCGSAEEFDFDFKYQKGSLLLNWATMNNPANKKNKDDWDAVITGSTKDDITKAKNFFGSNAATKN